MHVCGSGGDHLPISAELSTLAAGCVVIASGAEL
jgi:hypothetical protein